MAARSRGLGLGGVGFRVLGENTFRLGAAALGCSGGLLVLAILAYGLASCVAERGLSLKLFF